MKQIRLDTSSIPKHVTDALCADLLKAIRGYIRNDPEGAKALEERGKALFQRISDKETQKDETEYIECVYARPADNNLDLPESGSNLVAETKIMLDEHR